MLERYGILNLFWHSILPEVLRSDILKIFTMLNNYTAFIFQSAEESLSKIQSDNEMLVSNIDLLPISFLYIYVFITSGLPQ